MDPEFLRRLKQKPVDVRQARDAQKQQADQALRASQLQAEQEKRILQQEKEQKLARITALAPELLRNVPGMSVKLETLRVATDGGSVRITVLKPDDTGISWDCYYPNQPYPWTLSEDEYAVLYLFPYNHRTGNVLIPTGSKTVTYGPTPVTRSGGGSPGGSYEKAIFGVGNRDISSQLGISLKTRIQSPGQQIFHFEPHFLHVQYKELDSYDLRDVELNWKTMFKFGIFRPHTDYMYGLSLGSFQYPLQESAARELPASFEDGCSKLFERFLQETGQI